MGGFSIWHWLIVLLWIFGIGMPIAKILGRLGYSKALTILAFVPLVNIIALWLLASGSWPNVSENEGY
jgi:hypothetical protein